MASFNKFNPFVKALAEKVHNLGSDSLKLMLSNTAPTAGMEFKSEITEIAAGNGYTAGGVSVNISSSAQTGGVYKLVLDDPAVWTASGGQIGPFRYAILYNDTASGKPLIAWWDKGQSITLDPGEIFAADFDQTNGVLQLQ